MTKKTRRKIDAALKAFEQGKLGDPSSYHIDESKINQLGYELLNRDKTAESIEVFKLNVREFPKSSNVYDSLGEAYIKHGDKDLAIKNYRMSLELNSENTNAELMLKKLNEQ